MKWKDSGLGRKFEDAILAQEREQQIRKYQEQFKNKDLARKKREQRKKQELGKEDADPEIDAAHKELAQVDDFGCVISAQRSRLAVDHSQSTPSQFAGGQKGQTGGRSQPSNVLDSFRNMTTQLPIHGYKVKVARNGD